MKHLHHKPFFLFFSLGNFIVLFSSCSVVQSTYSSSGTIEGGSLYYYLPKGLLRISTTVKLKIYTEQGSTTVKAYELLEQSFEYDKEIIPDSKYLVELKHTPNALARDEVKIRIDRHGLLEAVDVIAEDRLPNIVEEITQAPAFVFSSGGGARDEEERAQWQVHIEEYSKTFLIDPQDLPADLKWLIDLNSEKYSSQEMITASFSIIPSDTFPSPTLANIREKKINGVLTRPVEALKFTIESKNLRIRESNSPYEFYVYLPSFRHIVEVPIQRAFFTKMENNLTFKEGMLTQNEIKKPSEVEGFITIPVNIAKAIISIPAQIFSFRIDNTQRKNELEQEIQNLKNTILAGERRGLTDQIETERLLLQAQESLLQAQEELKRLKEQVESQQKKEEGTEQR